MLTRRRRRTDERGQALILALGFIGLFALLVLATLNFAGVATLQHQHTEVTAQTDAAGEGGAAFAAADAARSPALTWCPNGTSTAAGTDHGTLTMADGQNTAANYNLVSCDPGQTATGVAAKGHCLLCILNQTPFGSTPAHTPGTVVFAATCAQCTLPLQTVGGDDYINGSIGSGTTLQACSTSGNCPGQATIGVLGSWPNGCCTPTPKTGIIVTDPLASILDPSTAVPVPSGCTSWQTCKPVNCQSSPPPLAPVGTWVATDGCSVSMSNTQTYDLYPGVWHNVSANGHAKVIFEPGVYVITGALSDAGQAIICASGSISGNSCTPSPGVTLYLGCIGGISGGQSLAYLPCPASGQSGGSISTSGNGQLTVDSTACPSGEEVPQCPGYDGVALLADPHLIDSNVSGCITSGTGCTLSAAGNAASLNGSVDLRSAGMDIAGNGGDTVSQGFLIANSLFMSVSGNVSTGLSLSGPGAFVAVGNACSVVVLNVYSGAAPGQLPTAVLQTQCGNNNSQSGIVDFNYLP